MVPCVSVRSGYRLMFSRCVIERYICPYWLALGKLSTGYWNMMNVLNPPTRFSVVLRTTLLFCAVFLFVNIGRTVGEEPDPQEPLEGVLILDENGDPLDEDTEITLDSDNPPLTYSLKEDIHEIIVAEGGALTIKSGTEVHVGSGKITIGGADNGGKLILKSSDGTKIINSTPQKEGETEIPRTTLTIDGKGKIQIIQGEDSPSLDMDNVDLVLTQGSVGTIDVGNDLVFTIGAIGGTGSIIKQGSGTFEIDNIVNFGGHFTVEEGTVTFSDAVRVDGNFILEEGTVTFAGKTAWIKGNVVVGKQKPAVFDEDENGDPILDGNDKPIVLVPAEVVSAGTIEFLGTTSIEGDFTLAGGEAKFDGESHVLKNFTVENGTVLLGGDMTVGTLKTDVDTIISGKEFDTHVKSGEDEDGNPIWEKLPKMTITNGGNVKGTLENIGSLDVKGGTLTFEGGDHTIGQIEVTGATLQISTDTIISNISTDTDDSIQLVLTGGILEIKKSTDPDLDPDTDTDPDTLNILDTPFHITVDGIGKIVVESDAVFQSGDLTLLAREEYNALYKDLYIEGGGTFEIGKADLETGNLYILNEKDDNDNVTGKMTVIFSEMIADYLYTESETQVNAKGDAKFGTINLAGNYDGNGNNLTIEKGGWITGQITGVNELTQSGTLLLEVGHVERDENGDPINGIDGKYTGIPTVSVTKWITDDTSHIRTLAGTPSGKYLNAIQVMNPDSREELLDVLNDSKTALYRPDWWCEQGDTYINLNLKILSINEYISDEWKQYGQNLHNVGGLLEYLSTQPEFYDYRTYLESLDDSRLQGALRNALAGELAGNAFRIAMQQPAPTIFRHLDSVAPLRSPFSRNARGQVREGFNVWFNPYGQAENASKGEDTFDGYTMSRFGFHLGGDVEIYRKAVAGVFFGYANPNVKSDLGRISANDYTAGVYLRTPTFQEIMLNMMFGFGSQDYTYKNSFSDTQFSGRSLFGSVELSRKFSYLTPLIALDFQTAAMDSFIVRDQVLGGFLIEPDDLSQAAIRLGLLGNFGRFRTRAQYIRQIAGNDTVYSKTSMVWDPALTATQVRGTQWGKDWLNVGFGGELLRTQHWRIFADYDFDLGKRTTSHLGSINTIFTW